MKEYFLTPIGRLVMGSLFKPQTVNAEGKPILDKTGKPRSEYFFALAIPKTSETHWSQTEWGAKIHKVGLAGFPQGQALSPTFAWKIVDGDSDVPNRVGKKPCDRDGYLGCWVLSFKSGIAPILCNSDGSKYLQPEGSINLGDYIQVYGSVTDNGSMQQPGVYLNHSHVAFIGFGERIVVGIDATQIGFGGALPQGASLTPTHTAFNPAAVAQVIPPLPATQAPPAPPYPAILTPALQTTRTMLPAANGSTYEQLIALGWTDALLIQHGYMAP